MTDHEDEEEGWPPAQDTADDAWAREEPAWEPVEETPDPGAWDSDDGTDDSGSWAPEEDPGTWEEGPIDTPDEAENEYLVFVEEDDDGTVEEDRLVLAVARQHALGEIQVHPEIEVDLRSTATPTSTGGLASSLFGALLGLTALGMFIATYPQRWYDGGRLLVEDPLIWFNAVFAVAGGMFLIIGTVLTHYGQRLQASGHLRRLRIVEQATGRSANLE